MPIMGFLDRMRSGKARKPAGDIFAYMDTPTANSGAGDNASIPYDGFTRVEGVFSSAGKVTFDNTAKTFSIAGGHFSVVQRVYFQLNPMLNP